MTVLIIHSHHHSQHHQRSHRHHWAKRIRNRRQENREITQLLAVTVDHQKIPTVAAEIIFYQRYVVSSFLKVYTLSAVYQTHIV